MGLKWRRSIWLNSEWLWPEGSVDGTSTTPSYIQPIFFGFAKQRQKIQVSVWMTPLNLALKQNTKHPPCSDLMQTYTTTTYISIYM